MKRFQFFLRFEVIICHFFSYFAFCMKKLYVFIAFFIWFENIYSQTYTWEDFVEDYFYEDITENNLAESDLQTYIDDLLDLHRNPFDINTISKEQLQHLPFLTSQQTDSIVSYVKRYGPMFSLQELHLIPRLDKKTIDYLTLFLYCEDKELSPFEVRPKQLKALSQQLISNLNLPLYKRAAFHKYSKAELAASPNKNYKGNPFSATVRYRGKWKDKTEWGITLQNDEGEPYGSYGNKVFDYQSFYYSGYGKKLIRKWIVGDFKINFGSGLTAGNRFWNNGLGMLSFSKATANTFTKHSSTDEVHFFRGGAILLEKGKLNMTLFGSYRQLDATLTNDGYVSTWLTSGLHRTTSELERKENLNATTVGMNIDLKNKYLLLGVSGIHTSFDKPFTTGTSTYKRYYMKGKEFGNYGFHYTFNKKSVTFQGEEAIDEKGGIAAINRLNYIPQYNLRFVLLHRYYDKTYNAPYAFAYSSGGHIKDENGIYGGFDCTFKKKWNWKTYFDESFHTFAIYKASHSSYKTSIYTQLEYQWKKDVSFTIKYKYKYSQEDNDSKSKLLPVYKNTWKLQSNYTLGKIKNVTALDITCYTPTQGNARWGKMLSHRASMKVGNFTFQGAGSWFNTTDYYSALHTYEPGPTYSFSYPSCFYHGIRGMLMINGNINYHLNIAAKYGITYYSNKKTISSAQQLINSPYKNDLYLQIVWKF